MLLPALALFAGLVVGALITWLVAGNRANAERQRAESLAAELVEKNRALDAERAHASMLEKEAARLEELRG